MLQHQRQAQVQAYERFAGFLTSYEGKLFETFFSGEQSKGKFFGAEEGPEKSSLKTELSNLTSKVSNPYVRFRYWIKEEYLDLHAFFEAVGGKGAMEGARQKYESKKKSANSDLEKLNSGKKTMKTFFKSQTGKADEISKLTTKVASADNDAEWYGKIIDVVTLHIAKNVIPTFKKAKIESYVRALKHFSQDEHANSSELTKCWNVVLNQIKAAYLSTE